MIFPKGSEWRKWDLHVHSPESAFATKYTGATKDEKWEKYITCIEKLSDISVIGITDYYSIDGYLIAKKYKDNGRIKNIDLLLPNVELRLDSSTYKGSAINIHIIFNPAIVEHLQHQFFQHLSFDYDRSTYNCTRESLIRLGRDFKNDSTLIENTAYREGANQFKASKDNLFEVLKTDKYFTGNHIIILSNNGPDGNSGLREDNLQAIRKDIYKLSDCIFSGKPNDPKYFLGKTSSPTEIVNKYGSLKPCLHSSDAHCLEKICKPNDDKFTWIKADPTFEGLKQIIHEPEDRVRIQKESPEKKIPKIHFCHIDACGNIFKEGKPTFSKTSIPLNPSMITIIGGRGTGKSLLLDMLYTTFHKIGTFPAGKNDRLKKISSPHFKIDIRKLDSNIISYSRDTTDYGYEYLHVRQGDVAEIAEDKSKLATEILSLLGDTIEHEYPQLQKNISALNTELIALISRNNKQDSEGNYINSIKFHEERKKILTSLISALTTEESREKIDIFIKNTKNISNIDSIIHRLESLKTKIMQIAQDLKSEINIINSNNYEIKTIISEIDFQTTRNQIFEFEQEARNLQAKLHNDNTEIASEFSKIGLGGDITGLLDKVGEYQKRISFHEEQILEARQAKTRTQEIQKLRQEYVNDLKTYLERKKQSFKDKFTKIQNPPEDSKSDISELRKHLLQHIDIDGECYIDLDVFFGGLKKFFDGRRTRNDALREIFPIKNQDDYFRLLQNHEVINPYSEKKQPLDDFARESDLFNREDLNAFYSFLFSEDEQNKYLIVRPTLKYLGKEPHQLSVGQRGTFYLCLKLATSTSLAPFIFDQPEDDLDNEFIVKELQPIFREIKKYRQVIIATHNANLVVNSDSEQVIVAKNEEENISFISGSLENTEIRNNVCKILEGGEAAFRNRERRYELDRNHSNATLPKLTMLGSGIST